MTERCVATLAHASRAEPPERGRPGGGPARALEAVPPPGLVLLSIVSIQVGAALATHLFAAFGPAGTVFLRVLLSALLLLAIARPTLDRAVRARAGLIALYGGTMATMNLCFYESIARIPLGLAVTIEFTGPLALAVATSRRPLDFLWVALAILGVALLSPSLGDGLDPWGVLLAAIAGAGWAAFVLLSRRVGQALPGNAGLGLGMAVAALCLLPFAAFSDAPFEPRPLYLLGAFAVAVLSTALPWTLEFAALRRMSPRAYGVLIALEPAAAALAGAVLLGQGLGPRGLAAVLCVTAAAVGVTLFERRGGRD